MTFSCQILMLVPFYVYRLLEFLDSSFSLYNIGILTHYVSSNLSNCSEDELR